MSTPQINGKNSEHETPQPQPADNRLVPGTTFNAEGYKSVQTNLQQKGFALLLEGVTLPQNSLILDLGSGHGGNTANLARRGNERGNRVLGIDISQEMVQLASKEYSSSDYPRLFFTQGSIVGVDAVVTTFFRDRGESPQLASLVLSNYVLHWVADRLPEVFRGLNRIQPLNGECHHFCGAEGTFGELFEAGYQVIRESGRWKSYFDPQDSDRRENGEWRHPMLVTKRALSEALLCSGYVRNWIEERIDKRRFDTVAQMSTWVRESIQPFMSRIPADRREAFVSEWIEKYRNNNPELFSEDGSATLLDRNFLVRATKRREVLHPVA